jgi:putative nucleotidyltransferase with HDIG domain
MRAAAVVYIGALAWAAAILIAASTPLSLLALSRWDAVGAVVFASAALIFQWIAVQQIKAGRTTGAYSSLMYLPLFGTIPVFPPIVPIIAAAGVGAASELVMMKPRLLWRAVLNISVLTIFFGTAAWTYNLLVRFIATEGSHAIIAFLADIAAFLAAVVVAFLINHATISGFIAARQGGGVRKALESFGGTIPRLMAEGFASTIAFISALLYNEIHVFGVILVVFPLQLIVRYDRAAAALKQANNDLLAALVKTIETRDPYTSGHSMRVAALAAQLAKDLRLPPRVAEQVEKAALLHDIGKIDSEFAPLIGKPYDLTADERSIIQTHATRGAELLTTWSTVPADVVRAVRHHHERYDGTGYPDQLKGQDIPLAARIIMLCDSVDAMLSDRPYRDALPVEVVEEELRRFSGRQFDPAIVDVVLREGTIRRAKTLVGKSPEALLV